MSVIVYKGSVHAHESLSLTDIVDIIELSADLKAKVGYYNPEHDYGTMSLAQWLMSGKNLVMAKGDKEKLLDGKQTYIPCESCGCFLNESSMARHLRSKKHNGTLDKHKHRKQQRTEQRDMAPVADL